MNKEFTAAQGYLELGLPEEARREFEAIPPGDALYGRAQGELMFLTDTSDVAAQSIEAEAGLALIREGWRDPLLLDATALRLHYAGRSREAYELTKWYGAYRVWKPVDFYGLATYASHIGRWQEAADSLMRGMDAGLDPSFSHMFADPDLEPLYLHAAEGAMDLVTALCFANPRFSEALSAFCGCDTEVEGMLYREIPAAFRSHMRQDYGCSSHHSLSPCAPEEIRCQFRAWICGVTDRLRSLVLRGICRAKDIVMDAQLGFARAAAGRGDFLAARHHTTLAITRRPECFAEFDAVLSPLGMDYFFNDIRSAWAEDPTFRKLIKSMTPSAKVSGGQAQILDDCGAAAKTTTAWLLGLAVVARNLEGNAVARDWNIEVIRRWPDDPAAFYNLLLNYAAIEAWDCADLLLANVPPAFHYLRDADALTKRIESRSSSHESLSYREFYGQPNLGGVVKGVPPPDATANDGGSPDSPPDGEMNPEICKKK